MILLTPEIRTRLIANAADPIGDHVPAAKFFNPLGAGVWLATMLEADGVTMHGIVDLDMDCLEYGTFSLAELHGFDAGLGLGIERDILFETTAPISVWLDIADGAGSIRAAERIIARFEREERDYEHFRLGLSRRRVKRPSGTCDRVKMAPNKPLAFSATVAEFSCLNFEVKALPPVEIPGHGGFVTIYEGDRIVWKGTEEDLPEEYR